MRAARAFSCQTCRRRVYFENPSACTAARRSASAGPTVSIGRDDLYPFVLAPAVEMLRLVHDLISSAGRSEERVSRE